MAERAESKYGTARARNARVEIWGGKMAVAVEQWRSRVGGVLLLLVCSLPGQAVAKDKESTLESSVPRSAVTDQGPSPATIEKYEKALRSFASQDPRAALSLLLQACSEFEFPECARDIATVHHSTGDCTGLLFYQQVLSQEVEPEILAVSLESCEELAIHCEKKVEEHCRTPEPKTEFPAAVSMPLHEAPTARAASVPTSTHPAEKSFDRLSSNGISTISSAVFPAGLSLMAEKKQIAGATLVSLGALMTMATVLSGIELATANKQRHRMASYTFDSQSAYDNWEMQRELQWKRTESMQQLTFGLAAASGLLITAGTFVWLSESQPVQWFFSGSLEPAVGVKGRF